MLNCRFDSEISWTVRNAVMTRNWNTYCFAYIATHQRIDFIIKAPGGCELWFKRFAFSFRLLLVARDVVIDGRDATPTTALSTRFAHFYTGLFVRLSSLRARLLTCSSFCYVATLWIEWSRGLVPRRSLRLRRKPPPPTPRRFTAPGTICGRSCYCFDLLRRSELGMQGRGVRYSDKRVNLVQRGIYCYLLL